MQYKIFYYKENVKQKDVLIFFNGWAMTSESIEHLELPKDTDLLVVWDYRTDDFPINILNEYDNATILAWSMGVWATNRFLSKYFELFKHKLNKMIAICGTAYPMSNEYGIPENIFEATLFNLNDENRDKFNRRMCGGKSLKRLFDALKNRSTKEIKDELHRVYYISNNTNENKISDINIGNMWTKVWIADKDRIIPPQNQVRYWENKCTDLNILENTTHFLFQNMTKWEELL